MASYIEDRTLWRLTTPAGTRYKHLGFRGQISRRSGGIATSTIVWTILVHTDDLVQLIAEVFPQSTSFPIAVTNYFALPQLPGLVATGLNFESFDAGKPTDSFDLDDVSPQLANNYYELIKVEITLEPVPVGGDANDPFTFLDISANATADYINSTAPKSTWQKKKNSNTDPTDPEDLQKGENKEDDGDPEDNDDPSTSVLIIVPKIEWTVRWAQIEWDFFRDSLIWRLRYVLGRLNANKVPAIYDAPRGALLCVSWSIRQMWQWRFGTFINGEFIPADPNDVIRPPIQLEVKFDEKSFVHNGIYVDHQDFWRPGEGWQTLLTRENGTLPTYEYADYGILFNGIPLEDELLELS